MDYITSDLKAANPASAPNRLAQRTRPHAAQHLPALTGLRFVLALWVILHHLTGRNMLLAQWTGTLPYPLQNILHGGYLAVQTFFLLSGFVLAQSYRSTRWDRTNLLKFAVARFARIYPAYVLSLVMVSWFAWQFLLKPGRTLAQKAFVLGDYAFLLQGWTTSLGVGWNTPAWSLSCEFFFYLCFPLLFLWLRRGRLSRTFAALAVSFVTPVLLTHAGVPAEWKPIHHLSDFLAGIAAARIYVAVARSGVKSISLGLPVYLPSFAIGAAVIAWPQFLNGTPINLNTVLRPVNAALLIGLACGGGFLARALSGKIIGYLGEASYSMYILHVPLLWWYSRYTFHRWGSAPPTWTGFLFIGAVIAVSIVAFEFVETRWNRRIRNWAASRIQPAQPSVMPAAA
jgi:peptidoglycan/LPS O-acetylase OafA/YrhL